MGILFGLATALSWGSADLFARFAARRIGSTGDQRSNDLAIHHAIGNERFGGRAGARCNTERTDECANARSRAIARCN